MPDAGGDEPLNLSSRAYHRILKLARTIANLAVYDDIQCLFNPLDGGTRRPTPSGENTDST
jgi:hypothetical protein